MILSWGVELLLLFCYGFSTILGFFFPLDSVKKNPTQKRPIVIVHGWLGKPPIYLFLKRYLERQGFAVYMTNFGLLLGDITESARNIQKFMDERQLNHAVLVGQSCGGIASYLYTQEFHGWDRVDALLCIASPFGGSAPALLPFLSTSARQMLPGSTFMKKLHEAKPIHPEKTYCITGKHDEIVTLRGDIAGANHIGVNDIGHVRIQAFSQEVYIAIDTIARDLG